MQAPGTIDHALFLCAASAGENGLKIWEEILQETSWEQFTEHQRRLLPAVWKSLSIHQSSFPGKAQLSNLYRYTWARNNQLQRAAEQVIEVLRNVEIPTLVLKGLALNQTVYQDMGTRPACDFDLLVPFDRADQAVECLHSDGWERAAGEATPEPALRLAHATTLQKGGLEFDLHWFALREARDPAWDRPLWEKAIPFTLGKTETAILCPDHQLMHLLVNASREPENRFRYLLDLQTFLRKYEHAVDLDAVRELLSERHLLQRLSYIPLEEIGWERLREGVRPGLIDRAWSWCSRNVNDGTGELEFGFFPFLDYWMHYYGRDIGLSLGSYLQRKLQLTGWRDFWVRLGAKLKRSATTFRQGP